MSEILLPLTNFEVEEGEFKYFQVVTNKSYEKLQINTGSVETISDLDIYYSTSKNPTLVEFHQVSNLTGIAEFMTVFHPAVGQHFIGIYCHRNSTKGNIVVTASLLTESDVETDIEDIEGNIIDEIDSDFVNVDGNIGDVTITINQDLSFLQDTIQNITENVTAGINESLESLEDSLRNSIDSIGSLQTESIDGFAESIDMSLEGINIEIVESLDEGNDIFNDRISELDLTINESLDSLENTIEENLADPLIIKVDELIDNIRAISHNHIDELITSLFERIKL